MCSGEDEEYIFALNLGIVRHSGFVQKRNSYSYTYAKTLKLFHIIISRSIALSLLVHFFFYFFCLYRFIKSNKKLI